MHRPAVWGYDKEATNVVLVAQREYPPLCNFSESCCNKPLCNFLPNHTVLECPEKMVND